MQKRRATKKANVHGKRPEPRDLASGTGKANLRKQQELKDQSLASQRGQGKAFQTQRTESTKSLA